VRLLPALPHCGVLSLLRSHACTRHRLLAGLEPGDMLANLFEKVPELCTFANLDLQV
jgi:hypothetical protein